MTEVELVFASLGTAATSITSSGTSSKAAAIMRELSHGDSYKR